MREPDDERMRRTSLIFVEGIMGAGKTTTAEFLAEEIRRRGINACFLPEGPTFDAPIHPLRVAPELPHPLAAWLDLTVDEFIEVSLSKWRAFVAETTRAGEIVVCDGLLFHGNLTDLMLMDGTRTVLNSYVVELVEIARPLCPSVIYLYHADVEIALRAVCDERGRAWESRQLNWKVSSPYATRRGLEGFAGLVQLYRDYRVFCDETVNQLQLPVLTICNEGNWTTYYKQIIGFLGCDSD